VTIGTSIVLIAAGAILKYAITVDVEAVDIEVVGTILMIVGIVGLAISLLYMFLQADRRPRDPRPRDPYDAPTRRDRF
jgi:heme/copper-type cytochrome/quinol oxidase subunit 2